MDATEKQKHIAYQKKYVHKLSKMKAAVIRYGSRAIDQRSKLAHSLKAWQNEVIATLGGDVTPQQKSIIEIASMNKMMISSIDAWIVSQPTLIRRDQSLIPVILQRQQLVNG